MPALRICGHRTFLAGDDLRFFTGCALALRLTQLALLIPLVVVTSSPRYNNSSIDNSDEACRSTQRNPDLIDNSESVFLPYVCLAFILAIFGAVIEIGILRTTNEGTPTEPERRWMLRPLCLFKMIPMSLLRVVLLGLGIMCVEILTDYCFCGTYNFEIMSSNHQCSYISDWITYFVALLGTHFLEASVVGMYGLYFAFKAKPQLPSILSSETKWKICCSCCCTTTSLLTCCLAGGRDHDASDYTDIALILSNFFDDGGTLDVVLSDVMVGFKMLSREQAERKQTEKTDVTHRAAVHVLSILSTQDTIEQVDVETGEEAMGFEMVLRHEIGGNKGEMFDPRLVLLQVDEADPLMSHKVVAAAIGTLEKDEALMRKAACRSVVYQLRWSGRSHFYMPTERAVLSPTNSVDRQAMAEGARFMRFAAGIYIFKQFAVSPCLNAYYYRRGCDGDENIGDSFDAARLLAATGLDNSEVVYARFAEGLYRTPYSIVIDHAWESVVVTIRGTLSLDDVVCDLMMCPESLSELGFRCGFDGQDCFAHRGILACAEWIYNDLESHGILHELLRKEDSGAFGYKLRLTGHSLGAGAASVLSFMLKSNFPDLRCLCFSPPGCTLSLNLAERCKDYLTSYVLDDDIVPRLSLESVEHLREEILATVARIKVTKHEAMNSQRRSKKVEAILHGRDSIPSTMFSKQIEEFHSHQSQLKEHQQQDQQQQNLKISLHPPGKIVHLVRRQPVAARSGKSRGASRASCSYRAWWAQSNDLAEVIISSNFVDDHDSLNVLKQLEAVAQDDFGLTLPSFTLEQDQSMVTRKSRKAGWIARRKGGGITPVNDGHR